MHSVINKPDSLNMIAYKTIKEAILKKKELQPGSRLVDSQLAEKFGISRTPVRDAIRLLLLEGLVENRGDKGYYVFSASETDINEIFDMRLMIDKFTIQKIITERFTTNYDQCMKTINDLLNNTMIAANYTETEFIKYDEQFHGALVSMINNSRLKRTYDELSNQTRLFREFTAYNNDRVGVVVEEHRRMLQAIKSRDLNSALEMVDNHIRTSRECAILDMKSAVL